MRRPLILTAKLLVTIGVIAALFWRADLSPADLGAELRAVEARRFVPWLLAAVAVKIVGILANITRWQLLLRGQALELPWRYLAESFFVGRFFGIATPGTLGLDGYRLYDSVRATGKPVECAAVLAIDKGIGLVSLSAVIAVVFPLGWRVFPVLDPRSAALVAGAVALGTAAAFAVLLLPGLTRPLLRLLPGRARGFGARVLDAATAYAGQRRVLLAATGLAVVGHVTTALMYHALLEGLAEGAPDPRLVLFSALMMTAGTLVAPTLGGEGVRELVFVRLLAGLIPPARAFLFGHLGFWIEKGLLGLPGGVLYAMRRDRWHRPTAEEVRALGGTT